jgi:hypothetical protein
MMLASFSDYLPLDDFAKIVVVCLVVAIVAPSAATLAIVGYDRRTSTRAPSRNASGLALIVLGVSILAGLVGLGLYVLFQH